MCAKLERSGNRQSLLLPPQRRQCARNAHHSNICIRQLTSDAPICINVSSYDRRRCDMQKRNSMSSRALKCAETYVHMLAGAETCIDVSPYRLRIAAGYQTCINVSPYCHRRRNMHKRKSISLSKTCSLAFKPCRRSNMHRHKSI